MHTATHKSSRKHVLPRNIARRLKASKLLKNTKVTITLKPIRRFNKKLNGYIVRNPYRALGIATLVSLSGVVLGVALNRLRHLVK